MRASTSFQIFRKQGVDGRDKPGDDQRQLFGPTENACSHTV
jgi:hypothetical protein